MAAELCCTLSVESIDQVQFKKAEIDQIPELLEWIHTIFRTDPRISAIWDVSLEKYIAEGGLYLAIDENNNIIGCTMVKRVADKLLDEEKKVYWVFLSYVLPQYEQDGTKDLGIEIRRRLIKQVMAEHEDGILMGESIDPNIHTIFNELGFKEIDLMKLGLLGLDLRIYRDYLMTDPVSFIRGTFFGSDSTWAAFAWGIDERSTAYKRYIKDPEKEG